MVTMMMMMMMMIIKKKNNDNDNDDHQHGNTALHEAAWKGFSQTVTILCKAKVFFINIIIITFIIILIMIITTIIIDVFAGKFLHQEPWWVCPASPLLPKRAQRNMQGSPSQWMQT